MSGENVTPDPPPLTPSMEETKETTKNPIIMTKTTEKDNNNFTEVKVEGRDGVDSSTKFKCNDCGHEATRVADIRRHITSKHIKLQPPIKTPLQTKRKQTEDDDDEGNDKKKSKDESTDLSESVIDAFDCDFTSTQFSGIDEQDLLAFENYGNQPESKEEENESQATTTEDNPTDKTVIDTTNVEAESEKESLKRRITELENQLDRGYQSYQELDQAYRNVTNENEIMKTNLRQKDEALL